MATKNPRTIGWSNALGEATRFPISDIYDVIEVIRNRPEIYLGERTITGLSHFLTGFDTGLECLGEALDIEHPPFGGFHHWVAKRLSLGSSSKGWPRMLLEAEGNEPRAFERFLVELDAYRESAPPPPGDGSQ